MKPISQCRLGRIKHHAPTMEHMEEQWMAEAERVLNTEAAVPHNILELRELIRRAVRAGAHVGMNVVIQCEEAYSSAVDCQTVTAAKEGP